MNHDVPFLPHDAPAVRCKVCAKKMQPGEEHVEILHHGFKHIVCCASCAEKFRREPELYTVE